MSKILQKAIDGARSIPYTKGQARVFSIITDRKGKILAQGSNLYSKSHPLQSIYSKRTGFDELRCNLHAELRVIIQAAKVNPKDCTITVARVGAKNETLPAYPCPSCRLAIKEAGFIREIHHTI